MKILYTTPTFTAAALVLAWGLFCPPAAYAEPGWFLGASLGASSMDEQFDDLRLDDSSSSFRFFGGWQFNEHYAVEGGYLSFGEFENTFMVDDTPVIAALDADGFTIAARGSWAVGNRFSIEPRVGVFFWNGNADINGFSTADPGDTNLYLGVGLALRLSDRFALTGDWTRYRLDDDSDSVSVDVLSLGLRVSLGGSNR